MRLKHGLYFSSAVLALVTAGPLRAQTTDLQPPEGRNVETVVVTAEKREERLQDVPVAVTVVDPAPLAQNNLTRIQDYFATIPGLNLSSGSDGPGSQLITIRGLSMSNYANPVVTMLVDDVPIGSSQQLGEGGQMFPDIDPSDLSRIEVLRGPQGTLYGADSLGGVIKIVTREPSLDDTSVGFQLIGEGVQHGEFGFAGRANFNAPLSDDVALRASWFDRLDPGYIENVTTGQQGINRGTAYGGHASLLWRLSGSASLILSALVQEVNGDGQSDVSANAALQPVYGLTQTGTRGNGNYRDALQVYSARLNWDLGGFDLVSVTGYGITTIDDRIEDETGSLGSFAQTYFGVPGSFYSNYASNRKFTQEVRVSSPAGGRVEWLAGVFFTHESTAVNQYVRADVPPSSETVGTLINWNFP